MTASFFRHLERHGVDWLLISGQATILYGAATFSEDIDLWVEPSDVNLERLTEALRASGASNYKLTPPLTEAYAHPLVVEASRQLDAGGALTSALEDALEEWLDGRVAPLRRADRHFWRGVIDELRELRAVTGRPPRWRPLRERASAPRARRG